MYELLEFVLCVCIEFKIELLNFEWLFLWILIILLSELFKIWLVLFLWFIRLLLFDFLECWLFDGWNLLNLLYVLFEWILDVIVIVGCLFEFWINFLILVLINFFM